MGIQRSEEVIAAIKAGKLARDFVAAGTRCAIVEEITFGNEGLWFVRSELRQRVFHASTQFAP